MAERCHTTELTTFVAVLVQSSQLGVSIAQVLHAQADDMRMRRRQRAEELARQAGIKMIFPLALLILPSLFVVILGPSIPVFLDMFSAMGRVAPCLEGSARPIQVKESSMDTTLDNSPYRGTQRCPVRRGHRPRPVRRLDGGAADLRATERAVPERSRRSARARAGPVQGPDRAADARRPAANRPFLGGAC